MLAVTLRGTSFLSRGGLEMFLVRNRVKLWPVWPLSLHTYFLLLYRSKLQVISVEYGATCDSADAPSLSGSTSDEFILFEQADGVKAGIDYVCHVNMTVEAYNGTTLPEDPEGKGFIETQTSPKSEKTSITTLEGKGKTLLYTTLLTSFISQNFCLFYLKIEFLS